MVRFDLLKSTRLRSSAGYVPVDTAGLPMPPCARGVGVVTTTHDESERRSPSRCSERNRHPPSGDETSSPSSCIIFDSASEFGVAGREMRQSREQMTPPRRHPTRTAALSPDASAADEDVVDGAELRTSDSEEKSEHSSFDSDDVLWVLGFVSSLGLSPVRRLRDRVVAHESGPEGIETSLVETEGVCGRGGRTQRSLKRRRDVQMDATDAPAPIQTAGPEENAKYEESYSWQRQLEEKRKQIQRLEKDLRLSQERAASLERERNGAGVALKFVLRKREEEKRRRDAALIKSRAFDLDEGPAIINNEDSHEENRVLKSRVLELEESLSRVKESLRKAGDELRWNRQVILDLAKDRQKLRKALVTLASTYIGEMQGSEKHGKTPLEIMLKENTEHISIRAREEKVSEGTAKVPGSILEAQRPAELSVSFEPTPASVAVRQSQGPSRESGKTADKTIEAQLISECLSGKMVENDEEQQVLEYSVHCKYTPFDYSSHLKRCSQSPHVAIARDDSPMDCDDDSRFSSERRSRHDRSSHGRSIHEQSVRGKTNAENSHLSDAEPVTILSGMNSPPVAVRPRQDESNDGGSAVVVNRSSPRAILGERAARRCEEDVSEFKRKSSLIAERLMAEERDCIAPFGKDEIRVGKHLGRGEFSNVYEITGFQLGRQVDGGETSSGRSWDGDDEEARRFLAQNAVRRTTGERRYALKYLRPELLDDSEKFITAACDLAMEAQFLGAIEHPHIIKLRGLAACGTAGYASGGNEGYFLIVDRLSETLKDRIDRWAKERKGKGVKGRALCVRRLMLSPASESDSDFLVDRLKIAYDIADALQYLHRRNIIYRDLKPTNLGFDIRGDIKLFDFGLAKELPKELNMKEDKIPMSMAGTMRYMPPEMLQFKPYNLKADTYSFGIILYEMLSLKTAYHELKTRESFMRSVVYGAYRPKVRHRRWPEPVHELLEMCWEDDMDERPTMEAVRNVLRFQVMYMRDDETDLDDRKRRSLGSIGTAGRSSDLSQHGAVSDIGWKSDSWLGLLHTEERDGDGASF